MRQISLHGQALGDGKRPLICVPLVATTRAALLEELAVVLGKRPDIVEWRVDFFAELADSAAVLATVRALRAAAGGIPLLFTRRAAHEGGERIALSEAQVLDLYAEVCASRCVDVIDYELSHPAASVAQLRRISRAHDVAMILSFHDFQATPDMATLLGKFAEAERLGADVGKVAAMPRSPSDVLTLLEATWQASGQRTIPLISMSMGSLGALSRIFGGDYGSALTFAVGQSSSAPGQIDIERLRAAWAALPAA